MYRILAAVPAAAVVSGHFWQIQLWQNVWLAFWISADLLDFSTAAVHMDYFQLKVTKVVLACCHLSDLMHSQLKWTELM